MSPPTAGGRCSRARRSMQQTSKLVLHTDDGGSNWSVTSAYLPPANQANFPLNKAPHYATMCFEPASAATALLAASPPTDYPVLCRTTDNGSDWEMLSDGMSGARACPRAPGETSVSSTTVRAGLRSLSRPRLRRQQHHRQQRGPAAHPGRRQDLEHPVPIIGRWLCR